MYKFINSGEQPEILLYSLIEGGLTAGKLIKSLQGTPADSVITLRINSDGGDVFDGIAMYNYLKDKDVHVVIDGICASAASIVAMAGKTITMKQGSMMMIHNPMTFVAGESEDLRMHADILDKLRESMVSIYMTRTEKSHDEITALMDAATWMNDTEALAHGFVDSIEEQPSIEDVSAHIDMETVSASHDFIDGVAAERKRMRALDELYTPARSAIINEAKYITGQTAEQVAVKILKSEATRATPPEINNFSTRNESADMDAFLEAVNRKVQSITKKGR